MTGQFSQCSLSIYPCFVGNTACPVYIASLSCTCVIVGLGLHALQLPPV